MAAFRSARGIKFSAVRISLIKSFPQIYFMGSIKPHLLIRPIVRAFRAYVRGNSGKKGLIKLNTNENPYPPSPKVLRAVRVHRR